MNDNLPPLHKQAMDYIGEARRFIEAIRRRGGSRDITDEAWMAYRSVRNLAWAFAPPEKSPEFADWVARADAEHDLAVKAAGLDDE